MQNKLKRSLLRRVALTLFCSAACVLYRTILLFTSYEPATGYFRRGDRGVTVFSILLGACVVTALFLTFSMRGKLRAAKGERSIALAAASAALAAAMLGMVFSFIRSMKEDLFASFGSLFTFLSCVCAGLGLIYLLIVNLRTRARAGTRAAFAMILASLMMFSAFSVYFNFTDQMNSPVKVLAITTLVVMALFFLYEARTHLSIPLPALYTAAGMVGFLLGLTYSIPNLIYHFVRGTTPAGNAVLDLLILGVACYILARMHDVACSLSPSDACAMMRALTDGESDEAFVPEADLPRAEAEIPETEPEAEVESEPAADDDVVEDPRYHF